MLSSSRPIRFLLNREPIEVADLDPHTTVLDWLRLHRRRTGTKEGCAEGDCGACTVAVGELHDGRVRYRAINACIQLLPMLDGRQLITVEDLAQVSDRGEVLHPVQQAMVDQHGSQCGFCTPGFVMSLFTLYHQQDEAVSQAPDRDRIDQAIAGNLCRCTGYAPIVRAARQAISGPPVDHFQREEAAIARQLNLLDCRTPLSFEGAGRRYFAPTRLEQLWRLLAQWPQARIIAGATDVGLWITKQQRLFDTLVQVSEVAELKQLQCSAADGPLQIGAAVFYTDAFDVLVRRYPAMRDLLLRLGAVQVRNAGTIGGNIANGSPIGDMPPILIALDARLRLSSQEGRREIALEEYFIDYGRQDLLPGECVESVLLPAVDRTQQIAVYKLSKRFDQDISALCGAFVLSLDHGRVSSIRICFGGMAATPLRARATEAALLGQAWDPSSVAMARHAMADDYTPLSDWRGSAAYRLLAAQNLLQRFYLETHSGVAVRINSHHG